jgi:hypothetical protein
MGITSFGFRVPPFPDGFIALHHDRAITGFQARAIPCEMLRSQEPIMVERAYFGKRPDQRRLR